MESSKKVNGHTFEYNKEDNYYSCRGEVYHDDEHDEAPEPGLWSAALQLEKDLKEEGYNAEADYSEKGWVEVNLYI